METIHSLLNLPEHATASDRACAVYELMQEYDSIQAARAFAEHELASLREATSHIFAESICAARGITDADAQEDIRAAWCADPYVALNALAGENITAANPYGCNQHGHEFKAPHGEGWKPRGQSRDSGKEEGEQTKADDDIDKEVDDYLNGTNDERWVKIHQWNAGVRKLKDEAMDIRESSAYRKGEPDAVKKYNEAKEKANKAAQRRRNIIKKAAEKRGFSGNKLDGLLRHYPETVLASRYEEEKQELEFELVCAENPYGCNQYGHEWRGKHGEGWQPRGDRQRDKKNDEEEKKKKESGPPKHKNGAFKIPALDRAIAVPTSAPGEKQAPVVKPSYMTDKQFKDALDGMDNRQRDNKKREETSEERTKRIVVGAIKDANSTLDELSRMIGEPPYDINDPRARAKVDLEYELTRTKERDTEEAAERLKQTTERARKALAKGKNLSDALQKIAPRTDKNGQGLMPFAKKK